MKNKNNTPDPQGFPDDEALRELFSDFAPEPDAETWSVIQSKIGKNKTRMHWKAYAVAASVLLSAGALYWTSFTDERNNTPKEVAIQTPDTTQLQKRFYAQDKTADIDTTASAALPEVKINCPLATNGVQKLVLDVKKDNLKYSENNRPETYLESVESIVLLTPLKLSPQKTSELKFDKIQLSVRSKNEVLTPLAIKLAHRIFKPSEAVQVQRVNYGKEDADRLAVRFDSRWLSYSSVSDIRKAD